MPAYGSLVVELRQANAAAKADVIEAARPYLIAALYQTLKRPIVVLTAHAEESPTSLWNTEQEQNFLRILVLQPKALLIGAAVWSTVSQIRNRFVCRTVEAMLIDSSLQQCSH